MESLAFRKVRACLQVAHVPVERDEGIMCTGMISTMDKQHTQLWAVAREGLARVAESQTAEDSRQ